MKITKLFAGVLAVLMLCSCAADKPVKEEPKGEATDAAAAYAALSKELDVWHNARAISLSINGSILSTYQDMPSAVVFSGVHQEQPSAAGKDVYSVTSFSYGDGYYTDYTYMTDSNRYIASIESGSTTDASVEPYDEAQELSAEEFAAVTSYSSPILAFEADLIESVTKEETETGEVYHFVLQAKEASEETIALLEHIHYIDTSVADITCETKEMNCDASFVDGQLVTISYDLNCDLTSEGEVMNTNFRFAHMLNGLDTEVSFELPNFDLVLVGEQ